MEGLRLGVLTEKLGRVDSVAGQMEIVEALVCSVFKRRWRGLLARVFSVEEFDRERAAKENLVKTWLPHAAGLALVSPQ